MEDLMFKAKKKPVTYGKAARKQGHGRPVDLDSEDELASMGKHISGKVTKPSIQRSNKSISKAIPSPRLTTPPISTSPSITSPSSSIGTKRTSPFLDGSPKEQKKRVRLTSTGSSSSLDDMFPTMEEKKRKPVPKLNNKRTAGPIVTTSDETQLMLDNQLQEMLYPQVHETPIVAKKATGLKMPTRIRGPVKSMEHQSQKEDTARSIVEEPHSTREDRSHAKQALKRGKTRQDIHRSNAPAARPRTPEKSYKKPLPQDVISPSNLELDILRISSSRTPKTKTPERKLSAPTVQPSPQSSPFRTKLKDRLTSDLDDMVVELDTSTAEVSIVSTQRKPSPVGSVKHAGIKTEDSLRVSSQTSTQSSQIQGPKVTYGAARWTFLPDEDEEMALLGPVLDNQEFNSHHKKSRQLPDLAKAASTLDAFEMDEDDEEEPTATMRSLHELKRAGGSQRVNRQIEASLDDIEHSKTKAQRISALLELVFKLKQNHFLRQFLDAGSEVRLLSLMDTMTDTIVKILYCTALLLIFDSPNFSTIAMEADSLKISTFLGKMLGQKVHIFVIAKMRNNHIPKDSQAGIEKLYNTLRTSSVWSSYKPSFVTGQIVGLTCLEKLVRRLRESGYRAELLSALVIDSLVGILPEWQADANSDIMLVTSLTLSALESASLVYSLSQDAVEESVWSSQTGAGLVSFATKLLEPSSIKQHGDLVSLTLRLCLNLSNGNPGTCAFFCNLDFIKSTVATTTALFNQLSSNDSTIDQDLVLDNLVLSLGLLINLSEKTEQARVLFVQGSSPDQTPLAGLLQIFTSRLQEAFEVTSETEIRSNVPFGYLAVLLGYLCKTPTIFSQVRNQLEGGNLRLLLIAIREFLQYHQQVEELRTASGEADIKISFISRLQGLLDELRNRDSLATAGS